MFYAYHGYLQTRLGKEGIGGSSELLRERFREDISGVRERFLGLNRASLMFYRFTYIMHAGFMAFFRKQRHAGKVKVENE